MGYDGDYTETEEAKAVRENYNRVKAGESISVNWWDPDANADKANKFALPTPAGVIWVDLKDMDQPKRERVSGKDTASDAGSGTGSLRSSLRPAIGGRKSGWDKLKMSSRLTGVGRNDSDPSIVSPSPVATSAALKLVSRMRMTTRTTNWRTTTRKSHRSSSSSDNNVEFATGDDDNDNEGSEAGEDELKMAQLTQELINFELKPIRGAESAKAAATQSAQFRERSIVAESHVRQMWRVTMGNAPGLKAEIAKLHATEQAKLAYREWELQNSNSYQAPPSLPASPYKHAAARASSPVPLDQDYQDYRRRKSKDSETSRSSSSQRSESPSPVPQSKRAGLPMLGWMFGGQWGGNRNSSVLHSPPSTPPAPRRSRGEVLGPFTA